MVSQLCGCDGLVELCEPEPHVSGEDLNSYKRKSEEVMVYAGVACVCTYVPEMICLELLEDDRLALRLPEIQAVADEELAYVLGLNIHVFEMLASFLLLLCCPLVSLKYFCCLSHTEP